MRGIWRSLTRVNPRNFPSVIYPYLFLLGEKNVVSLYQCMENRFPPSHL